MVGLRESDEPRILKYREEVEIDKDGGPRYRRGILQDISDIRTLERQAEMGARLESVGTLAGGIGHDFNNLLTSVTAGVSLARLDMEEGNQRNLAEELGRIEDAAEQARQLARQLLVFSKGSEPVRAVVCAEKIAREAATLAVRGSSLRVEFDADGAETNVFADPGQLHQIFFNLAINARDATNTNSFRLLRVLFDNERVNNGRRDNLSPGQYTRIRFVDNGSGIEQDVAHRIFDPFFSTKGSSGLGLSITQRIARNHGGNIEVKSTPEEGTEFIVYLPAATPTQIEIDGEADAGAMSWEGEILVLDDEKNVLETYRRMATRLGFSATLVPETHEAIDEYRIRFEKGKPFNLVILDLTIKGSKGGDHAAKRILEMDPNANVIISSGYSENPIVSNFHEFGIKAFLPKPFDFGSLRQTVAKALG